MSMLLLRRIENRHIFWTALSMVAIGLIVPGGFGVKPPQWFHDRPTRDVASELSVEPDKVDKLTSVASLKTVPKADGDLAIDHKTQQTQDLTSPTQGKSVQVKPNQSGDCPGKICQEYSGKTL